MGANRVKKYYDNKGKLKPNLKIKREKPKPSRAAKALKILGRSEPVGVEKELAPLYDGKTDKAFLFGAPIPKSLYNKYHDFVGRGFGIAFNCHKAMLGGKVTLHMPKKLTYHEENALIDLDGRIYPTTIATVAEAAAVLIEGQNFAINGLTQSVKTASQSLTAIIGSMIHFLKTGQLCRPIILTPNKDEHITQFKDKYRAAYELLKRVVIRFNGKCAFEGDVYRICDSPKIRQRPQSRVPMTIAQYFDELEEVLNAWCDDDLRNEFDGDKYRKVRKLSNQLGTGNERTPGNGEPYIFKISKSWTDVIKMLILTCSNHNVAVHIYRDESHYAASSGSINDVMMEEDVDPLERSRKADQIVKDMNDEAEAFQTIYQLANKADVDVRWILCSATGFINNPKLREVRVRVDRNYCGINRACTSSPDDPQPFTNVPIKRPLVMTLLKIGNEAGVKNLDLVTPKNYANGTEDYRNECAKKIAKVIDYLLLEYGPAHKKKHRGLLLRFINNNEMITGKKKNGAPSTVYPEGFITKLKRYGLRGVGSRAVRPIEFLGDDTEGSVKSTIDKRVRSDEFYVIIVTGRARMGDTFPRDCGYGLDFTAKSGDMQAILQGVLGRMTGYFKDPLIAMSEDNYKLITNFMNMVPMGGKSLCKAMQSDRVQSLTIKYMVDNPMFADDPIIQGIFQKIRDLVFTLPDPKNPSKFIERTSIKMPVTYFKNNEGLPCLITDEEFEYLDRNLMRHFGKSMELPEGSRLLKPGEVNQIDRKRKFQYDDKHHGSPRTTLRHTTTGSKSRERDELLGVIESRWVHEDGSLVQGRSPSPRRTRRLYNFQMIRHIDRKEMDGVKRSDTVPGKLDPAKKEAK